jgi:hypothetical protein
MSTRGRIVPPPCSATSVSAWIAVSHACVPSITQRAPHKGLLGVAARCADLLPRPPMQPRARTGDWSAPTQRLTSRARGFTPLYIREAETPGTQLPLPAAALPPYHNQLFSQPGRPASAAAAVASPMAKAGVHRPGFMHRLAGMRVSRRPGCSSLCELRLGRVEVAG